MTISVTKEDIKHGKRCDPDCCPIGRALSRAGIVHFGVVGPTVMVADDSDHATGLPLPKEVKDWILEFDGAGPVEPITFDLILPAKRILEDSRPLLSVAA
jgi:hypothetical protein